MKPLKPKPELEKSIEKKIRRKLEADGWGTWKTHGSRFQAGFPDLYCLHLEHGQRWIEVKRPGHRGKLTSAQVALFERWAEKGMGIWILTDKSLTGLLDGPPNWRDFLTAKQSR